ncbi:MAG: hypothetical protein ABW321_09140 [Polyangiales bacterium]
MPREPDLVSSGLWLDVGLGIGASLWIDGEEAALWKPVSLSLNIGYELDPTLAIIVRGSSWLKTDGSANEFLGAGVAYRFLEERMYVAGALGASLTRTGPISDWQHHVQGLALVADVAQAFPLTAITQLAVGAHFQIGTPLLGDDESFTSIAAGIFIAFGVR